MANIRDRKPKTHLPQSPENDLDDNDAPSVSTQRRPAYMDTFLYQKRNYILVSFLALCLFVIYKQTSSRSMNATFFKYKIDKAFI